MKWRAENTKDERKRAMARCHLPLDLFDKLLRLRALHRQSLRFQQPTSTRQLTRPAAAKRLQTAGKAQFKKFRCNSASNNTQHAPSCSSCRMSCPPQPWPSASAARVIWGTLCAVLNSSLVFFWCAYGIAAAEEGGKTGREVTCSCLPEGFGGMFNN